MYFIDSQSWATGDRSLVRFDYPNSRSQRVKPSQLSQQISGNFHLALQVDSEWHFTVVSIQRD
ncbi:MAG: hypothetical protein ICV63_15000 [Coleofasciculus sp. Co-bin14]|nr:hypothetical protein [Coleofasciculus sp. Co-bin14]